MNMESLWEQTCALLSEDMSYVSYSTWIVGNLTPVALKDDTLVISVTMDQVRPMIQSKYGPMIERRLAETAGRPIRLSLLSRAEAAQLVKEGKEPQDDRDPHLNPNIRSKASWWAGATDLPTRRRWRWLKVRRRPTIRCLFTAAWGWGRRI